MLQDRHYGKCHLARNTVTELTQLPAALHHRKGRLQKATIAFGMPTLQHLAETSQVSNWLSAKRKHLQAVVQILNIITMISVLEISGMNSIFSTNEP